MGKNRLRSRQKTLLSTKMRIVIGASIFITATLLLIIIFNLGEVKDSRAFSSGDYRSVTDGDWSEASSWEVYDGEGWSSASMPPGPGVKNVVISGNSHVTITDEIAITNLIIDEGSKLTLDANTMKITKMNGKGELLCNGTLSLGSSIIDGDADLIIGSKATLMIGADDGIDKKGATGNLQLKGKRTFSKDAAYIYNGTVKQHTGLGLPVMLKYLIIENPSGVELDQSVLIIDKLTIRKGTLYTGRFTIAIGASHDSPANIECNNGGVNGRIKRWYGSSNNKDVSFPLIDGQTSYKYSFSADAAEFQIGMIEMIYHEGVPDDAKVSPFEIRHVVVGFSQNGYFTAFLSNGPDEAWLKVGAIAADKNSDNKIQWLISKNTQTGSSSNQSQKNPQSIPSSQNIQNILCGPNPFDEQFYIRFYSENKTIANIQIMNGGGQMVFNDTIHAEPGNNQFKFEKETKLNPGIYILRISNSSEIHTLKIVKES